MPTHRTTTRLSLSVMREASRGKVPNLRKEECWGRIQVYCLLSDLSLWGRNFSCLLCTKCFQSINIWCNMGYMIPNVMPQKFNHLEWWLGEVMELGHHKCVSGNSHTFFSRSTEYAFWRPNLKYPYKPGTQENGIGCIRTNGIGNDLGSISCIAYHLLRQSPQTSTFLSFVGTKCQ